MSAQNIPGINREVILNNVVARSAAFGDMGDPESPFMVVQLDVAALALTQYCEREGWAMTRTAALRYVRKLMAEQVKSLHAVKLGPSVWDCKPFIMWARWQMAKMLADAVQGDTRAAEVMAEEAEDCRKRYAACGLYPRMPF